MSPYAEEMFANGVTYADGDRHARNVRELQEMFVAHGATEVAMWVGTERSRWEGHDNDSSLDAALRKARLAADIGLPFNPMLFLCRLYADMPGQPAPRFDHYRELTLDVPWESLTIDEMADVLQRYAAVAAAEILSTGVHVNLWDLGQEVDLGISGVFPRPFSAEIAGDASEVVTDHWTDFDGGDWWRPPDGVDPEIGRMSLRELLATPLDERISWLERHVWPHVARLLAAAAAGVRSVDPGAKFSTHIGLQPPVSQWALSFWRAMRSGGYRPDQIGVSIYPAIHGSATQDFVNQKAAIRELMNEFGVPVMITEYGYPAGPMGEGIFGDWRNEVEGYPLNDVGQAALLEDFIVWGLAEGIAGIRPFGIDLIVPGWADMTFFRQDGDVAIARPALRAYENAMNRAHRA